MLIYRIAFLVMLFPMLAIAQKTIEGRVVEAAGRKPLPFANVFISNTTKGQNTDENGRFKLTDVPSGAVDLVISYVGYETFTVRINLDTLNRPLLAVMMPKVNELQEIAIKRLRNGFEEYFPLFRENFIGKTGFSEACKLKNPKALWFSMNDDDTELTVHGEEALVIENKALGYLIKYTLEDFQYNFRSGYTNLLGYVLFEEIKPKNERQQRKWEENRRIAYLGSPQHFFKSLINQQLTNEGFKIFKLIRKSKRFANVPRIPELRDSTGKIIRPASKELVFLDTTDLSLSKDTSLTKIQDGTFAKNVQYLVNQPLSESAATTLEAGKHLLYFDQYLYVVYGKEFEEPQFSSSKQTNAPQVSILTLVDLAAIVEPSGYLSDPLSVIFEGRWANEKMGELMPIEYSLLDVKK